MSDSPVFPLQPVVDGRFVANKIVERLLDEGPFDMNDIARWDIPAEHREQFAQLIGYSLSGFSELSYVSDEAVAVAQMGEQELVARNRYLRRQIQNAKKHLQQAAAALFEIHPDDLPMDRNNRI